MFNLVRYKELPVPEKTLTSAALASTAAPMMTARRTSPTPSSYVASAPSTPLPSPVMTPEQIALITQTVPWHCMCI